MRLITYEYMENLLPAELLAYFILASLKSDQDKKTIADPAPLVEAIMEFYGLRVNEIMTAIIQAGVQV